MTHSTSSLSVDFSEQVALITGAAGTIGSEVARRLAAGGATLCLADHQGCESLASELTENGCTCTSIIIDVSVKDSVQAAINRCLQQYGKIDILVTVAGVISLGAFEDIEETEWDRVTSINLKGVFLCNQAVISPMKAKGYGRIVNIGSVLGKNGGNSRPWIDKTEQNRAGNAAYGAAKAGVHAITFYLAKELAADGITVNAVAPGPIASPMTTKLPSSVAEQVPMKRLGKAEEVATAVAFLCASDSSYITGEILDVNGGLWMD